MSVLRNRDENHDLYKEFNDMRERMLKHNSRSKGKKTLASLLTAFPTAVLVIAVVALLASTTLPSLNARLKGVSATEAEVEIRAELAFSELDYPLEYELYEAGSINYMTNSLGVILHSDIEADPRPVSEKYVLSEPVFSGEITGKETFLHFDGLSPATHYLLLLFPGGDAELNEKYMTELVFTTGLPETPTTEPSGEPTGTPVATDEPSSSPSSSPSVSPSVSPSTEPSPEVEPTPSPTKRPYYPPTPTTPVTPTPGPRISVIIDSDLKQQEYYVGSGGSMIKLTGTIDVSELKLQNLVAGYMMSAPTETDGMVFLRIDGTDLENTEFGVNILDYNADGSVKTLSFIYYSSLLTLLSDGGHSLDVSVRYLNKSGTDTTVESSDSFTQSTVTMPGISVTVNSESLEMYNSEVAQFAELTVDVSLLGITSLTTSESYETMIGCLSVSASGSSSDGSVALTVVGLTINSVTYNGDGTVAAADVTVVISQPDFYAQDMTVTATVTYHSDDNVYSSYMTFSTSASATFIHIPG